MQLQAGIQTVFLSTYIFNKIIYTTLAYVQHALTKPGLLIRMIFLQNEVSFNSDMLFTQ